jgi:lipopolysaccharide biosynthesis protein
MNNSNKHRLIAIYLPQFHPFKENDEWWGKGFTEWNNVVKAKPRYRGHYQPHLPADLGFYDLRVPETRMEQARLAKEHGIYGFCYYHYWFNGHLLMERPLEEVLKSHEPDFPFMICWANETWKKAWGESQDVLISQTYSETDDLNHIRYLIPFLKDPRYIRINNKPVISIYRSTHIPDIDKTINIWRNEASKEDIELYICRFESFREEGEKYLSKEINAAIEFQPHNNDLFYLYENKKYFGKRIINKISRSLYGHNIIFNHIDYKKYVDFQIKRKFPNYKYYPCVTPMWDNASRRKHDFFSFYNISPELFGKWLNNTIDKFIPYSQDENLIFINAWNEWAEGNHLEPDMKWGKRYLEEIKKIVHFHE